MAPENYGGFQKRIDHIIEVLFLGFIPRSVTPNQVTALRFVMIPFVCWFLLSDQLAVGLVLFAIAASTDFIDGAMARTRNQITEVGKIIDPIADKLLILTVMLYIGFDYLIIQIFVVFIALELVTTILGAIFKKIIKKPKGANIYGKIKMILQSVSIAVFLLAFIVDNQPLIQISEYALLLALVFAVISGVDHVIKEMQARKYRFTVK
jgi:CDP-diacylglycerol--glycerol-3-phosphate 3-phosphatidyltransferase